ncbi:hypothetical protein [Actinophytocola sp.]|uniref:hypothetical protein n=1 Tax=Actinophytocola sp. TaxID=1872138 RepID=UPI002ED607C1
MADEPIARGGIEGYPTGLSWGQHHRVARVVASASTDAEDCALLLAILGVHPADGLPVSSPSAESGEPGPLAKAAGLDLVDTERGIRRRRRSARWTRD